MAASPAVSREVRLVSLPDGLPTAEHFEVVEAPVPVPGEGQALVRNRFFHVFAPLRMLIAGESGGSPYPPVYPGDTLVGASVAEVISAPEGSGLLPGALVRHWSGWREYAAVPVAQCMPLGDSLPDPVAHLGHGGIAYAALTRGAEVRPGDTVFVSAASGGIGSMAGQIARLLGAGRVIGSTGTREKGERLVSEFGYDEIVYREDEAPIDEQLAKAAPEGIDVVIDSVGGEQLAAAVDVAREGARIVLVGALSGQLDGDAPGTSAPVRLDSFPLIAKRITLRGFVADDMSAWAEWQQRYADWSRSGAIAFPHVRVTGLEAAPQTLLEVIAGRHLGTVVVELP